MPLDRDTLRDALLAAFQAGMDNSDWSQEDAAGALADAIDAYVRSADVVGVEVEVVDEGEVLLGTGKQTQPGSLS